MDILKSLVSGQGCAPDGAALAQNPLGAVVQHMVDTMPMQGVMGPGPGV